MIVFQPQMSIFSAISWQEQVTFHEMMMMSALYYTNTRNWIFLVSSLKQQFAGKQIASLRNIILVTGYYDPTSLCSYTLVMRA